MLLILRMPLKAVTGKGCFSWPESLPADHQRPDPREVHFFNRKRLDLGLRQECGKIQVRFESDVHRERRDDPLDPRHRRIPAAEMIEDDDASAGAADAAHLARHANRIGHHTDHIRRIDDIEAVVCELETGCVHLQQSDVADAFTEYTIPRLLEHGAGQVDARDRTVRWIERHVNPGADSDLEYAFAWLDPHPADRVHAPGMQRRTEHEVVHRRELL